MRFAIIALLLCVPARADELPPGAILRLGSSSLRHAGQVKQVVWSRDGKRLASVGNGERVRLWEASTGKQLASLPCACSEPCMAWSPDEKLMAIGGWDLGGGIGQKPRLWDVATGRALRDIPLDQREAALSVAFSPDGKQLAVGNHIGEVKLFDVATAKLQRKLKDGALWVRVLAYSPDGTLLAAAGQDKLIRLWDLKTGKLRSAWEGHSHEVYHLCFSPDGKTLASGDSLDTWVRLWDVETGKVRRFWKGGVGFVSSLAWSPDGKRLASSASSNNILHILDVESGKSLGRLIGHDHTFKGAAFHPDGKTLASAGGEGRVRLWDLTAFKEKEAFPGHAHGVVGIAFNSDATRLLTGSPDCTARVWDLTTGKELLRYDWPMQYWILTVAFSPDDRVAMVGGHNETRLFDARTGKLIRALKGQHGIVHHSAFSGDGKTLVTGTNGGTLRWWDLATGEKRREERYPFQEVYALRFRDGDRLFWEGCKEGLFHRTEWGKEAKPYGIRGNWSSSLYPLLSPDGRMVATADSSHGIVLDEIHSGKARLVFANGHRDMLRRVVFSPNGRLLASGSDDSTVVIWDTMGTKDEVIQKLRDDLDACWTRLGGAGAGEAYRAIRALASVPEKAVPFLDKCLGGIDERSRVIAKWIAELDHPRFAVREKATQALIDHGASARSYLEDALRLKPSLEARRRLEAILAKLPKEDVPPMIRSLRAVETLERIGTKEAKKVLERLAKGAAEDRLTLEAKSSLDRMR